MSPRPYGVLMRLCVCTSCLSCPLDKVAWCLFFRNSRSIPYCTFGLPATAVFLPSHVIFSLSRPLPLYGNCEWQGCYSLVSQLRRFHPFSSSPPSLQFYLRAFWTSSATFSAILWRGVMGNYSCQEANVATPGELQRALCTCLVMERSYDFLACRLSSAMLLPCIYTL